MMYHGKLYGKLWNKYFDTDHTTDEWNAMEKQIKELKAENEALKKANGLSTGKRQLTKPAVSKSALLDEWNAGYNRGCEDTHAAYNDQIG